MLHCKSNSHWWIKNPETVVQNSFRLTRFSLETMCQRLGFCPRLHCGAPGAPPDALADTSPRTPTFLSFSPCTKTKLHLCICRSKTLEVLTHFWVLCPISVLYSSKHRKYTKGSGGEMSYLVWGNVWGVSVYRISTPFYPPFLSPVAPSNHSSIKPRVLDSLSLLHADFHCKVQSRPTLVKSVSGGTTQLGLHRQLIGSRRAAE